MINLVFVWHMHQPFYTGKDNSIRMPWVFLHAIKDYYDMPYLAKHFKARVCFNLTPSLIEQLKMYLSDAKKSDYFLGLISKNPSWLTTEERKWVVKVCKSSQFDTMIKPFDRYVELYGKNDLNDNELNEIETLFLLSWCGNYLRKNNSVVKDLINKGKGFGFGDKTVLIGELIKFVNGILPFYKSLYENKEIDLLTTPYAHPILPLLIDLSVADEKLEDISLGITLKDDAKIHIEKAISVFEDTFGGKPAGFWPAEGAISEDAVSMLSDYGIGWVGSDEDILKKTDISASPYKTYRFKNTLLGFRDKTLSDRIGFMYKLKPSKEAVDDFISYLKKIEKDYKNPTVYVILDGENAWEFYPNNGYDFLSELYKTIVGDDEIEICRVSECKAEGQLNTLAAGSWINGDFKTWIGDKYKNRAWELLFFAKRDFMAYKDKLSKDKISLIENLFLITEGSDWFWWYGHGHYSEYEFEYDKLFRENIIQIYELMEINPPAFVFDPITTYTDAFASVVQPKFAINPIIDGKVTSFFEWLGSGVVDESMSYSTMDTARGPITKIHFGQNQEKVFLRFDGEIEELRRKGVLTIHCLDNDKSLKLSLSEPIFNEKMEMAAYKIIEVALSKELFDFGNVRLIFEFTIGDRVVQILPGLRYLTVNLNEDFSKNWFV